MSTRIAATCGGYTTRMGSGSATIEQLARDTVQIADPETALRALTALRHELDRIEPELVGRALNAGSSWSRIASALGVTKQAAHHKHHQLAEHVFTAASDGPKILVTSEARRTVQLAREEARRLAQPAIGTEHLLLGILRCQQSHAVKALAALGVTHQAAAGCLQTTIASVPVDPQAPRDGNTTDGDGSGVGVSAHARRILEGSLREALNRGDGYIGVEHLLLALLTDSRNGAVQTLEALDVTPARVRRQLEREWRAVAASATATATTTATDGQPARTHAAT
jgi:ATP-dependent Clp protease ATP-binding subunit ClpA